MNELSGDAPVAGDAPGAGAEHGWRRDLVGALLAVALGAAVLLHVRGFPTLPAGAPGPALFPGIVGALLVVFGLVLAARSLHARARTARQYAEVEHSAKEQDPDENSTSEDFTGEVAPDNAPRQRASAKGRLDALAVLGLIVGYLLLVDTLGFPLTMGGLLFLLMWRLGAKPWLAFGAAAITTAAIVLMFQQVLLVPLPAGPLG